VLVPARSRPLRADPALGFVLLGLLAFALDAARPEADTPTPIVVDAALRDAFVRDLQRRHGRPPTEAELEAAIVRHVEEEALLAEALALGLDRADPIVRRRLVQKMEFVLADREPIEPPTEAELAAALDAQPERYRLPDRYGLSLALWTRSRHGARAEALAEAALASLIAPYPIQGTGHRSDPVPGGERAERVTERALAERLGARTAAELVALPLGEWRRVDAPFGPMLARLERVEPGALPPLDAVRGAVQRDLLEARRAARRRAELDALLARHPVRRDDRLGTGDAPSTSAALAVETGR
jgi:peptidyl-prolyl cis-trans isomerase C